MYLFFDTETTGFADMFKTPDWPGQPQLVQLGALMTDEAFNILAHVDLIVEPDGWQIPEEASKVHGITTDLAVHYGIPRKTVLSVFNHLCKHVSAIIAHNLDFDDIVMLAQYTKESVPHRMEGIQRLCTMKAATPHCKLPHKSKYKRPGQEYKWPSLEEACQFYLGHGVTNAHRAMSDCLALIELFQEMRKRGHI